MGHKQNLGIHPMHQSHTIILDNFTINDIQPANLLTRALHRIGWHVYASPCYQSESGRVSDYAITFSDRPVASHRMETDLLVCLTQEAFQQHHASLHNYSIVLLDSERVSLSGKQSRNNATYIPFSRLAREMVNQPGLATYAVLGAIWAVLDQPLSVLWAMINDDPQSDALKPVIEAGYTASQTQAAQLHLSKPAKKTAGYVLTGQEGLALGAVAAAAHFVSINHPNAYPLFDSISKSQTEIVTEVRRTSTAAAAINQAIGAALAGVRAVAIMAGEDIATIASQYQMAAATEVPLVIVGDHGLHQSITHQSNLSTVANLGNGDQSRVIISPATPEECFVLIQDAINLAEKYQTPVVLLLDGIVSQAYLSSADVSVYKQTVDRGLLMSGKQAASTTGYHRYEHTVSGISPRKLPGQQGEVYMAYANSSQQNIQKRLRKLDTLLKHGLPYKIHGQADADVTLICYGYVTNHAIQAMATLQSEGIEVNVLQLQYLAPFPTDQIHQIFRGSRHLLIIDDTVSGQLSQLIKQHTGIQLQHQLQQQADGTISPEQIARSVQQIFTHRRIS